MKKARSTAVALALTLITTPLWAQTPSPTTPSYSSGLTGAWNSAADTSPSLPAQQAPPPTVAPAAPAAANTNTSVKQKHPAARAKPAPRHVATGTVRGTHKASQPNDNVANELNGKELERGSAGNGLPAPAGSQPQKASTGE
jgi:hypothetical protein